MLRFVAAICLCSMIPARALADDAPVPLREAAAQISVPEGFEVTLFAGEPDVVQPIAFAFDDRGRLWVVECYAYPDWDRTSAEQRDRVLIFEDADGDGRFDSRKVFWDQGRNLSGIELGFGGVWLCSTPNFLFLPDRDGDDVPDGEPEVLLDGWSLDAKHNVFNGLTWGPDGWLYGCNGILATSYVGRPGTPDDERVPMNCGVWRYHPTRHVFEVVAWGTTNPWGLDFDARGEMFITNCVIKHLFHVIPGAHYERMYGQDLNPYVYGLMESCADHIHWGGGSWQDSRGGHGEHDKPGGGHAHAGAMIYLGENWPREFRGGLFTCNIHGARVNQDVLERRGSGYVARHGDDFLFANDPWFRGLELKYGPDGSVYLTDWSDTGECHDYEDIHRENGRIFKIRYQGSGVRGQRSEVRSQRSEVGDLAALSDIELVGLHRHENEWYVRHARRLVQERAAAGVLSQRAAAELRGMFAGERRLADRLRALWTLYAIGGLTDGDVHAALGDADETVRAWGVRLDLDDRRVSNARVRQFEAMAVSDTSPVVRLALASGLQRLPLEQRRDIAEGLVAHADDANDANIPLMIWYGIEPLVAADGNAAAELIARARIPLVRQLIARRVSEGITQAANLAPLVRLLEQTDDRDVQLDVLRGIHDVARGLRNVPMPHGWAAVARDLRRQDQPEIRELATALSLIFGDREAMRELRALAVDRSAKAAERRRAIDALAQAKDSELPELLLELLDDAAVRSAALRGLAFFDHPVTARELLSRYETFSTSEKQDAIHTLVSRREYALPLVAAVEQGRVPADDLSAFTARQLAGFQDDRINAVVQKVWGAVRPTSEEKAQTIADYRQMLTPENLESAEPAAGRVVFEKTCSSCHRLFDAGRAVGPELTGSQRGNVDYVLENLIDPSAVVGRDYQMTTLVTSEGRILTGIVAEENDNSVTIRTANEDVIVPRAEIEVQKKSAVSMMPEGMLDKLSDAEVLNLVRYLASPQQVPLPDGASE